MREEAIDALLRAAIKSVEELEAILAMVDGLNSEEGKKSKVSTDLRAMAGLLDRLPLVQNSLLVIKKRLRKMLSFDPDKTPPAIRVFSPREIPSSPSGTSFAAVDEPKSTSRSPTTKGIGLSGPPKKGE